MGKLTPENIKYIHQHNESIHPAYKTQIYFCFDSKETGVEAFRLLKSAYGSDINYSAYGLDWRDFYVGFTSKGKRDEVYNEIITDLGNYDNSHPNELLEGPQNPTEVTVPGDDTFTQPKSDYATYIVIGAAAIILVLLLWDRKKK